MKPIRIALVPNVPLATTGPFAQFTSSVEVYKNTIRWLTSTAFPACLADTECLP
ncbi:MAG: hypothetical protein IPP88_12985 [Betaproteobacteria bacterium]|nr:hypothetical protein [Betaproteobacteria bacterium]